MSHPISTRIRRRALPAIASAVLFAGSSGPVCGGEPYARMLDRPALFTGTETLPATASTVGEIRIGVFAPDNDRDPAGRNLVRGAALAVDEANAGGGVDGLPLRLVRRWNDDPWRGGAREVVRLVFEDRVVALIGGPDGASTHIAQQVATKAHLPLLAPVSADPSLTHTRVPWIFRLPPDDAVQARVLSEHLVSIDGIRRVGLISATDHDSRTAAVELRRALEAHGRAAAFHFVVDSELADAVAAASRVRSFSPDGLVIALPTALLPGLVEALAGAGVAVPLFLPWAPGFDGGRASTTYRAPLHAVVPFRPSAAYAGFERRFRDRHEELPTAAAAYGYDAATLVIEAARRDGDGRFALLRELQGLSGRNGVTGPLHWDNGGGNTGEPIVRVFAASEVGFDQSTGR